LNEVETIMTAKFKSLAALLILLSLFSCESLLFTASLLLFFEGQTKKVLVEGGSGTSHVFQPPEVHVQFVVVPSARRCQRPRRARYAG